MFHYQIPDVLYLLLDNYEIAYIAKPGELDSYGRQKQDVIKGANRLPFRQCRSILEAGQRAHRRDESVHGAPLRNLWLGLRSDQN